MNGWVVEGSTEGINETGPVGAMVGVCSGSGIYPTMEAELQERKKEWESEREK